MSNILITGGAKGIGAAVARRAAKVYEHVYIIDNNVELGEKTASGIKNATFLCADVASVRQLNTTFKGIDQLGAAVNCAGILGPFSKLTEYSYKDWQRVWDVNVFGVFLCLQHEIKLMKKGARGVIVNVSSVSALKMHTMDVGAYVTSKYAVNGLTEYASAENPQIQIIAICPDGVDTDMQRQLHRSSPITGDAEGANLGWVADLIIRMASGVPDSFNGKYLTQEEWYRILMK